MFFVLRAEGVRVTAGLKVVNSSSSESSSKSDSGTSSTGRMFSSLTLPLRVTRLEFRNRLPKMLDIAKTESHLL